MNFLLQVGALTLNGVLHIPRRLGNSLVIVLSIAGVVAVFIPVFAMYRGFGAAIRGDGRADRAIVVSRDALTEDESSLSRDSVAAINSALGIKHDARGQAMASAEVVLVAPRSRKRDHVDVNVTLRGVGEQYFAIRPEQKLVAGRMFRPGNQELLAGEAARRQFEGLEIGRWVRLQDGDWLVVGIFTGGNGARDSELIADAQTVMSAYKLNSFSSVTLALDSAGALGSLSNALQSDGRLSVAARSEPDYLAKAAGSEGHLLRLVTYTIGSIMGLGAVFAALNAMYSAVTTRAVEAATLRAIGFASGAVMIAMLIEGTLLALIGAALGVGVSYAAFNGATISTVGGAVSDAQLVYSLTVTPHMVAGVTMLACALGLAGGLWPAMQVGRANIADALHEK
jgi:putative ABC transport system permease protein